MNKLVRKVFLLGLAIIFLILTTVTFTYSWLSFNTSVSVSSIELEVSQGYGMQISVDGITYSSKIEEKDIERAIVIKYLGYSYQDDVLVDSDNNRVDLTDYQVSQAFKKIKFGTVSTLDGTNFYGYHNSKALVTGGRYISFDLYFKALNDDTSIYFNYSDNNYDTDGTLLKNTEIGGTSIQTTADSTKANCLLAGLSTIDSTGDKLDVEAYSEDLTINSKNAMRFMTKIDDEIKIYEPNIGLGSYATNLDSSKYKSMYLDASYLDSSKNAAFTYINNLKSDSSKLTSLDYEDVPYTYKDFYSYEASHIITLEKTGDTKMVSFTYWLEGWDADCFDAVIGSKTTISLAFTTKAEALYEKLKTVNYHSGDQTIVFNYFDYNEFQEYLPYNSGKTFEGWYTDETYQMKFDFKKVINNINTSYDCYALWS